MYYCIDNEKLYTLEELKEIYNESTDENKGTFERWLELAQDKNGSLREVMILCDHCFSYLLSCGTKLVEVASYDNTWEDKKVFCEWCESEDDLEDNDGIYVIAMYI